jgi:hypothetical protein
MQRGAVSRNVLLVLAVVAAAATCRGITWAAALPAWQGPDELAHYAYVERLAAGRFPPLQPGVTRDSAAVEASLVANAYLRFRFAELDRPLAPGSREALPRERDGLPEEGWGAHGASIYPPAYYILALPFYSLPGLETATARLSSMRVLSALLAGGIVVVTFLLVLEATGRAGLALAGGALATLPPMMGQVSGIVNPDALLALALTGLAWALVRQQGVPRSRGSWAHVAAWSVLAGTTKPVGVPAAACVVAAFVVMTPVLRSRRARALVVAAVASVGLLAAGLAVVGGERVRAPFSFATRYMWDFYRPRLPALVGDVAPARAWSVWVESGVGSFGWLSVWLPSWAYALGLLAVAVAAVASVYGLLRDRSHVPVALSCAAAVLLYVLVLHAAEAESLFRGRGLLLQGRYLTALTPVAAAGFLAAVASLPRRARSAVVGGVLAIWAFLAVLSLDSVVSYFAS